MWQFLLCTLLLVCTLQARVMIVVDNSYYQNSKAKVDRYVNEVTTIDRQNAELLIWNWNKSLDVRSACYPLWQALQQKYVAYRATTDVLKGAVFVGQLPIPMFRHYEEVRDSIYVVRDTAYVGTYPHDYYFMDIYDQNNALAYPLDTAVWKYSTQYRMYESYLENSSDYKSDVSDGRLDIWVTRILAENIDNLREGLTILTEYQILDRYFDRLHARMTEPAAVPSRSFSMSGITEGAFRADDILRLDSLRLPFHARFDHPNNNPSNFISQLQSGPYGNVNFGSYNGTRFRGERNQKDCRWSSLLNVTTGSLETALDTCGYEWVGIYEHGGSHGFACNGVHHVGDNGFVGLNGNFYSFAFSPMVDSTKRVAGGYNSSHYRFSNADFPTSPWGWGPEWRAQDAYWKAKLPIGTYDIYINYSASPLNADSILIRVDQHPFDNKGSSRFVGKCYLSQKAHVSPETPGSDWELLGRYGFSAYSDTAAVKMITNGNGRGRFIIDAVKFVGVPGTGTQGITVIVDDQSPNFFFPEWEARTMMDMQDEDMVNHRKYSKVPFFLANSCHLSEYTAVSGGVGNNTGLLFAMSHNGLTSMGTVNSNYLGLSYRSYIAAINRGECFGDAFLAQANFSGMSSPAFILLGSGTLKAQASINYGSTIMRDYTLANGTYNYETPLHLISVSTIAGRISTIITNKEIRVMPETRFNYGSTVNLIVR